MVYEPVWVIECHIQPSWRLKSSCGTIYSISLGYDGIDTFPKGICLKMNIIVRLEFELAYSDSAIQRSNHYAAMTTLLPLVTEHL